MLTFAFYSPLEFITHINATTVITRFMTNIIGLIRPLTCINIIVRQNVAKELARNDTSGLIRALNFNWNINELKNTIIKNPNTKNGINRLCVTSFAYTNMYIRLWFNSVLLRY
jgi:hypothetical protein